MKITFVPTLEGTYMVVSKNGMPVKAVLVKSYDEVLNVLVDLA